MTARPRKPWITRLCWGFFALAVVSFANLSVTVIFHAELREMLIEASYFGRRPGFWIAVTSCLHIALCAFGVIGAACLGRLQDVPK
jgi:hypothetical protein